MPWPVDKTSLNRAKQILAASLVLLASVLPALSFTVPVSADRLASRTLRISNSDPSATTDYTVTFTINNYPVSVGSLDLMFCSNTPIQGDTCDVPPGLDVSSAQLTSQTGLSGFSLTQPTPENYDMVMTRPTAQNISASLPVVLTFHNIINPNVTGSYYLRVSVYSAVDLSPPVLDFGGFAYAITANLLISSYVPPFIIFCSAVTIPTLSCSSATGDYINFGELSATQSRQAASQLLVATNAPNGYVIQVYGTTMTAGNNVIAAISSLSGSQPGQPQFGINLRANTIPAIGADPSGPGLGQPAGSYNVPNQYQFVSNDVIASSPAGDNYRRYTASYIVNVPSSQAPGIYAGTLTYVVAGSF